jgi:general secretion pathway protein H
MVIARGQNRVSNCSHKGPSKGGQRKQTRPFVRFIPCHYGLTCGDKRGFTLLEMLISLFLITVMVGLSSVFFVSRQPSEQLKAGARDIVSSIRQARTLARVSGELKVVSIDIDQKTFGIEGRRSKPLPVDTQITITDPVNGIITRGIYRIEFYPSGLSGIADITLEGHNKKIAIHLDPVVGASVVR